MMTVVKADSKKRLTIRGLKNGERYIVREESDGWFIKPQIQDAPLVNPVKMNGRLMLPFKPDRRRVRAALRADRELR